MSTVPSASAPYDPITAQVRAKLFHEAALYLKNNDLILLEKACAYAFHAHDGQKRKSGEPYITHPISVTLELAKWRMDIQALCAGLMHDVLEDTPITKSEMAVEFGDTITNMVDGLSKLENLKYDSKAEQQAESFRKLILAMIQDLRVIIVKLSDRLHNMRTLGAQKAASRQRIATETLEVYAPIANRLGLDYVYRELQDLSFAAMYPHRYRVLQKTMSEFKKNRQGVINRVLREMSMKLVSENIEAQIIGREKNLYNIHQKMQSKGLKFKEIMDIYGFRIIVNSIANCYVTLGALHSLYQPKPGKIKDFIAIPKTNGYRSLHTTLSGPHGLPLEVQIRTREMHHIAERGVASHWRDHTDNRDPKSDKNEQLTHQWLQNLMDLQAHSENAIEFLEHVKIDLYPNETYVFTPKGKIITLPRGATPLDFAYFVHTDIGNKAIGARINNVPVPLRTRLKTGDTIEIITSPEAKPNPAWLKFVISSRARSAIRNHIKNTNREDAIQLGNGLLARALSSLLPRAATESNELKERYLHALSERGQSWEDILYKVGIGQILPVSVAMDIANIAGKRFGNEIKLSPIHISGSESAMVHLGKCCMPLPGDSIRAIAAQGQGLIVHRDICPTLLKHDPQQQLDADWANFTNTDDKLYDTAITVSSMDTHALLAAMTAAISEAGGNISAVDTLSKSQAGTEGFIEFKFSLNVRDHQQLNSIITRIRSIPQVRKVIRV